jgi:hypothetical protein
MGVSLNVLPPVRTQPVDVISFSVARDGRIRLETTAPIAGPVSMIVMSTVSSSTNGFLRVVQASALLNATHRRGRFDARTPPHDPRAPRLRYDMELGLAPVRSEPRDISIRITCLVIPGT